MDSLYLILLALFLLVIIPWIMRQRRLAAVRHILNQKKQNKENSEMKELAKRFIGEECIIYTITSNDGSVQGVIKEIDDGGMVMENWRLSIWILSPVSGSIRERRTERKRTSYWTKYPSGKSVIFYPYMCKTGGAQPKLSAACFCCPILPGRCQFCSYLKLLPYRHTPKPLPVFSVFLICS